MDQEGYPVTRAMMGLRRWEGLDILYFSTNTTTNKVEEIKKNKQGSVYFFDSEKFIGCSLKGSFEVMMDLEAKNKVWLEGDELYYPQGIMDEDFCVLIFKVDKGRIYSKFHSIDF